MFSWFKHEGMFFLSFTLSIYVYNSHEIYFTFDFVIDGELAFYRAIIISSSNYGSSNLGINEALISNRIALAPREVHRVKLDAYTCVIFLIIA